MTTTAPRLTFAFNLTFTRPDEGDANTYRIGYNAEAATREAAEAIVRRRNAHLTLITVDLAAVMNEDGDIVEQRVGADTISRTAALGIITATLAARERAVRSLRDEIARLQQDLHEATEELRMAQVAADGVAAGVWSNADLTVWVERLTLDSPDVIADSAAGRIAQG